MKICKTFFAAAIFAGALMAGGLGDKAQAQGPQAFEGDFMVRILGSGIFPDAGLGVVTVGGAPIGAVNPSGADIDVTVVPATTLTYFLSKNIGIELFCCISTVDVRATGALALANEADVASTSFFAPTHPLLSFILWCICNRNSHCQSAERIL